ncbi:hypothetical protein KIPB_000083 [Kipferlia bialata]|uniref:Uncharacterized protein n=1 Tax=Kipferlia bialata TaxID=797122 RepID=A0A9K3GE30_9EUKA|nr:hypothetical protein KIPB_000083 [Kipferlia bialata]|eukprot:g83.t1
MDIFDLVSVASAPPVSAPPPKRPAVTEIQPTDMGVDASGASVGQTPSEGVTGALDMGGVEEAEPEQPRKVSRREKARIAKAKREQQQKDKEEKEAELPPANQSIIIGGTSRQADLDSDAPVDPLGTGIPAYMWNRRYDSQEALRVAVEETSGLQWVHEVYEEEEWIEYLTCDTCVFGSGQCHCTVDIAQDGPTGEEDADRERHTEREGGWHLVPPDSDEDESYHYECCQLMSHLPFRIQRFRLDVSNVDLDKGISYNCVNTFLSPTEVLCAHQSRDGDVFIVTLPQSTVLEWEPLDTGSVCHVKKVAPPGTDGEQASFQLLGGSLFGVWRKRCGNTRQCRYILYVFDKHRRAWVPVDEVTASDALNFPLQPRYLGSPPLWLLTHVYGFDVHLHVQEFCFKECLYQLFLRCNRFQCISADTLGVTDLPYPYELSLPEEGSFEIACTDTTVYMLHSEGIYSYTPDAEHPWLQESTSGWDGDWVVAVGQYLVSGIVESNVNYRRSIKVYDTVAGEWVDQDTWIRQGLLGDRDGVVYSTVTGPGSYVCGSGQGKTHTVQVKETDCGEAYLHVMMLDEAVCQGVVRE